MRNLDTILKMSELTQIANSPGIKGAFEVSRQMAQILKPLEFEGVFEASRHMAQIFKPLEFEGAFEASRHMAQIFKPLEFEGVFEASKQMAQIFNYSEFKGAFEASNQIVQAFNSPGFKGAWEAASQTVKAFDVSVFQGFSNALKGLRISDFNNLAYQVSEAIKSNGDIISDNSFDNYLADDVDIQEFQSDLKDLNIQNENWQQRLAGTLKKWASKNPVLAFIFISIIIPIIVGVGCDLAKSYLPLLLTKKTAHVREEPATQSSIVYIIPPQQSVVVIETVPYWLKIEFYPNDIDTPIEGWVSKRSLEESDIVATPPTTTEESDHVATSSTTTCDCSES